jgi:translation elongation factor P/translation initiation factor 5A
VLITAQDARRGLIVRGDEGEVLEIDSCALCPPGTTLYLMVEFQMRDLRNGEIRTSRRRGDDVFQVIELPERELVYLDRTDTCYALMDPLTFEDYHVPHWVGRNVFRDVQSNQRLLAGFFHGQPLCLRKLSRQSNQP